MRASQYASSPNSLSSSAASRTASFFRARGRHHQSHPSGRRGGARIDRALFATLPTRTDIGHIQAINARD
jgi:hypothetical protein